MHIKKCRKGRHVAGPIRISAPAVCGRRRATRRRAQKVPEGARGSGRATSRHTAGRGSAGAASRPAREIISTMSKQTGQNNSLSQFASEFPHSVRQNTSIGGPSVEDKHFTQVRINNFLTELGNCRHKQFPRSVRRRREHIRARRDSLASAFSTPRLPGLGPRAAGAVATAYREAVG